MYILGHIHTLNDEEVIDRSLRALLQQTRPLDGIVLVDNGSTDATLARKFPAHVTIIRHPENVGTSGAVVTGFKYALEHHYDWIWIFDADSAPRPDALEKLMQMYENFSLEQQRRTWMLAGLAVDVTDQRAYHGVAFHARGCRPVTPSAGQEYYPFDGTMWTGSLYKLEAVRQIGLPSPDYVLDWGEYAYGYEGKVRGYQAFMHLSSIVDHNIGGQTSRGLTSFRLGPLRFTFFDLPPIRCYYIVRNTIYFWLYRFRPFHPATLLRRMATIVRFNLNFLLRFPHCRSQVAACWRGLWDGLFGKIHHRY